MKQPVLLSFVLCWLMPVAAMAQEEETGSRVTPKEFSIPATPVFDLMGVTTSQVNRTSDIKDFKVDWSFKSWKLNPNLAIQSQPIWELLYHRKNLEKYQAASPFMRRLASLDLSVGSVQDENSDRRLGFAVKMNLLKTEDPLMARELYAGITEQYNREREEINASIRELTNELDTTTNLLAKPDLRSRLQSAEEQLGTVNRRRNEEISNRARVFVAEHWNASSLDIALGKVNSYLQDSAGSLKSLRKNRSTAFGAWMNGSLGIGKKFLLSGLLRSSWYEEELNFLVRNEDSGEETSRQAFAKNTLFTLGLNLRYGSPIYTFFVEFLYERKGLKTPVEALKENFTADPGTAIIDATVNWDIVHPSSISIGGDWRISRSVLINYGMRCVFDKQWTLRTFTPVATIACMMR
ncbi:MAG: hypothetical protein P0Y53_08440 [Candidatus Pseudobacter hemicellulosilyticus]|uniref:Uncharacterized protein n=1 Tax=Candidatus Pseudobacter hemicellulosilyticus TaxID=3121375 RepID=A0AAJ5WWK1_9BACT|nr:MAG: hypothetical protein P0Y53_08440 [Pseudobacter sp.]